MPQLQINQQNCRKSKIVTLGLISNLYPAIWDIVLLQEPYTYPNSCLKIASPQWNVIYPADTINQAPPSSLILINANLTAGMIMQIHIPSNLIKAITIKPAMDTPTLSIFNITTP